MPKKTRKEKIRADQHRLTSLPFTFTFEAKNRVAAPQTGATAIATTFVRRDLLKTLVLGILFITAEILMAQFLG